MSETAEQLRLRLAAAELADQGIARIVEMLRLRLLLPEERPVPGGIGIGPHYFETWQTHARSLERVLTILLGLSRRLREGPVPERWHTDELEGGGVLFMGKEEAVLYELRRYFFHYAAHLTLDLTPGEDVHLTVIQPAPTPPRARLTRFHAFVPDPLRPESVLRLEPTLSQRGPVIDLWLDEAGRLFYPSHGSRQYIVDLEGQFRDP